MEIEEVAHSIHLQFQILLNWRENRATYNNLKKEIIIAYHTYHRQYVKNHEREKTENVKGSKRFLEQDTSLNALTQEDINQLWLPFIIYANTDQKVKLILSMNLSNAKSHSH